MTGKKAALLIGGNLGDREENLDTAIHLIHEKAGNIINLSSIYSTAAWGIEEQPDFLNQALLIQTDKEPLELLDTLLEIETEMGRIREQKWGPRINDIDILNIDDLVMDSERLKIPHPYLSERRFSLVPLVEISPDWIHPVTGKSTMEMLAECTDEGEVKEYP